MPRKGKVIAGMIRVSDFPLSPVLAIKLAQNVDHLVCCFDGAGGYADRTKNSFVRGEEWYELFKIVKPFPENITVDMYCTTNGIGNGVYHIEEMFRRLDNVRPDIVIEPEGDGMFDYDGGFLNELDEFIEGDYDIWMMLCESVTCDGRKVPDYPFSEHCRAAKWYEGMTYSYPENPGFCVPKQPVNEPKVYRGKTWLKHFPLFTKELEEERWKYYGIGKKEIIYNMWDNGKGVR